MITTKDVMRSVRSVTYCSFADDEGCRGVCILNGDLDSMAAAKRTGYLGINPGGELITVACQETDENVPLEIFEAMWVNQERLIPEQEARRLFDAASIRELEEERNLNK